MSNAKVERHDLTSGSVWKKLLVFFLPIVAGTLIQQLYNAVDALVVGRFVGTTALAAVGGSASQIINMLIGFFVAMTSGSAVVIAQIYGSGQDENVRTAAGNAISVSILLGLVLAIAGYALTPSMLTLLKTPEETMADSITYLRIFFFGVPFILALNMESNILRAVGDSVSPFIYMVAGCITNIVLDFSLVVFFGLGVAGVAIATVIAQIINFSLLTWKLLTVKASYALSLSSLRPGKQYLGSLARLGLPSGFQSTMYTLSNLIIQVAVNSLGTLVVASWAMAAKVDGIVWAVSNALSTSITAFIAQNIGAGKLDRVHSCMRQGTILSASTTAVLSAVILLLARPFLSILTTDPEVVDMTIYMLYFFVPFYVAWSLIDVFSAVLRGAGDALPPLIIVGSGICLFRVVWILTVFRYYGTLEALCSVYPVSWIITVIALAIYSKKGNWLRQSCIQPAD